MTTYTTSDEFSPVQSTTRTELYCLKNIETSNPCAVNGTEFRITN
jgi:hypothetical protein